MYWMLSMSDDLIWLQSFYLRLCDGDWEHGFGFKISTLDNPGWAIDFDVADTKMESVAFDDVAEDRSESDWVRCSVKGAKFVGRGGPSNLAEMIGIFRRLVESCIGPNDSPWLEEPQQPGAN